MSKHKEQVVSVRVYLLVLLSLMGLLVLTTALAFVDIDRITAAHHLGSGWNTAIALTIAIAKGLLIVLFFMHARYSSRLTWVFAAAGFVWLTIMLVGTVTDYLTRNHPRGINPRGEPRFVKEAPPVRNPSPKRAVGLRSSIPGGR